MTTVRMLIAALFAGAIVGLVSAAFGRQAEWWWGAGAGLAASLITGAAERRQRRLSRRRL